jgi:hypothetical protein
MATIAIIIVIVVDRMMKCTIVVAVAIVHIQIVIIVIGVHPMHHIHHRYVTVEVMFVLQYVVPTIIVFMTIVDLHRRYHTIRPFLLRITNEDERDIVVAHQGMEMMSIRSVDNAILLLAQTIL